MAKKRVPKRSAGEPVGEGASGEEDRAKLNPPGLVPRVVQSPQNKRAFPLKIKDADNLISSIIAVFAILLMIL